MADPLDVETWGSVASHVLTFQGDMAGEAKSQPGACTVVANNKNSGVVRHGRRVMESALGVFPDKVET